MKAQELRISNIVEYLIRDEMDAKKEWWEPSQIDAQDILWLSQNPDDEDYRPMTLTEEWLVRFGFEKSPIGWFTMPIGSLTIYVDMAAKTVMFSNIVLTNFQHIHRLQNLIFDFTGEELTTTPIQ